jgi:hypothetical protein
MCTLTKCDNKNKIGPTVLPYVSSIIAQWDTLHQRALFFPPRMSVNSLQISKESKWQSQLRQHHHMTVGKDTVLHASAGISSTSHQHRLFCEWDTMLGVVINLYAFKGLNENEFILNSMNWMTVFILQKESTYIQLWFCLFYQQVFSKLLIFTACLCNKPM